MKPPQYFSSQLPPWFSQPASAANFRCSAAHNEANTGREATLWRSNNSLQWRTHPHRRFAVEATNTAAASMVSSNLPVAITCCFGGADTEANTVATGGQ
jgi:hypothetical protein